MEAHIARNSEIIVRASGEIDLGTVSGFTAALEEAVRDSAVGFIIDLTDVTYIDSAGIQSILSAYRAVLDANGSIALVIGHQNVKDIFHIINADKFPCFFVCSTVDAAEHALSTAREG